MVKSKRAHWADFPMPGWVKRFWPRQKRWWHCLRGMFDGHQMQDITIRCIWYDYPVWIGCSCGEVFWWDPEYCACTDLEKPVALEFQCPLGCPFQCYPPKPKAKVEVNISQAETKKPTSSQISSEIANSLRQGRQRDLGNHR